MDRLILASASPRRKQLLTSAALDFDVLVSNTAENYPPGLPIEEVPVYIAREKAAAVSAQAQDRIIVAADTVVVIDDEIIGKPADADHAFEILTRLSGRTHRVITGVVIRQQQREMCFHEITEVHFHPLTAAGIRYYIDQYAPYDKAGAYAIQEWIGVTGIAWIRGDFYNVMGLPVSRLLQELRLFSGG